VDYFCKIFKQYYFRKFDRIWSLFLPKATESQFSYLSSWEKYTHENAYNQMMTWENSKLLWCKNHMWLRRMFPLN